MAHIDNFTPFRNMEFTKKNPVAKTLDKVH